jgi:hypothetical protein
MLQFQEQLEATSAAASSAEQQLGRVLADWRASVAQMAATQARRVYLAHLLWLLYACFRMKERHRPTVRSQM